MPPASSSQFAVRHWTEPAKRMLCSSIIPTSKAFTLAPNSLQNMTVVQIKGSDFVLKEDQ